jgi:hypothetical protein
LPDVAMTTLFGGGGGTNAHVTMNAAAINTEAMVIEIQNFR